MEKPQIDYDFIPVTIHLKPWKNKTNNYCFYAETNNVLDSVDEMIAEMKKGGKYKRRIVESVSISISKHIKL